MHWFFLLVLLTAVNNNTAVGKRTMTVSLFSYLRKIVAQFIFPIMLKVDIDFVFLLSDVCLGGS